MTIIAEEIKTLPVSERAALFQLLSGDEELVNYLLSSNGIMEELKRRDEAFVNGKMELTDRKTLSERLKSRRNGL
jgi:hypothetical protein